MPINVDERNSPCAHTNSNGVAAPGRPSEKAKGAAFAPRGETEIFGGLTGPDPILSEGSCAGNIAPGQLDLAEDLQQHRDAFARPLTGIETDLTDEGTAS